MLALLRSYMQSFFRGVVSVLAFKGLLFYIYKPRPTLQVRFLVLEAFKSGWLFVLMLV